MMRRTFIGFDRRLDKEWLDVAAALVAEGLPATEARNRLLAILQPKQGVEAAQKTLTVLGRLWWAPSEDLIPMRSRALALLPEIDPAERIAIHWALCLAVYPLFFDTARFAGRLLGLQGEVKLQQLDARVMELWGERGSIPRAVQRIVRSMVQWGVLEDTDRDGVYRATKPIKVGPDVGSLLVEGLLHGQDHGSLTCEQLYSHPSFFPFDMCVRLHDLQERKEFEVLRQGVDVDCVRLKK